MNLDPEIKAMSQCFEELKDLNQEAKLRVVNWLLKKFELAHESIGKRNISDSNSADDKTLPSRGVNDNIQRFESIVDLFAMITPKTDSEKALAVAAFLQVKSNLPDLTSNVVQKELKHLGHGVSNITRCFDFLEGRKPKLMIQTRKDGKSKQARKRYKVTIEGLNTVNELINNCD